MEPLKIETRRGVLLDGVLFGVNSDTVLINITGIHGNFYSNPFYYNFGEELNQLGIDFIYAQTNDAFGRIRTKNVKTDQEEIIGSWNERFEYTLDDLDSYITFAVNKGYRHIYLSGHSLGANKVIYYLSKTQDPRVERFLLLSPANVEYMRSGVTADEVALIHGLIERGQGNRMLPFPFMGWVECIAYTADDWMSGTLNNVHVENDRDFSQVESIDHIGALLIGTYDRFTYGDPAGYLKTINSHFKHKDENELIFIEKTGHTYQQKEAETANKVALLIDKWRKSSCRSLS